MPAGTEQAPQSTEVFLTQPRCFIEQDPSDPSQHPCKQQDLEQRTGYTSSSPGLTGTPLVPQV